MTPSDHPRETAAKEVVRRLLEATETGEITWDWSGSAAWSTEWRGKPWHIENEVLSVFDNGEEFIVPSTIFTKDLADCIAFRDPALDRIFKEVLG